MLYMLEWDNGLSYGDRQVTFLGAYASVEDRNAAKERYRGKPYQGCFPFACGGDFVDWDFQMGQDMEAPSA